MSSCGSTNIGTKLRGSKSLDKGEETLFVEPQDNEDKEDNETLRSYNVIDIIRSPRATLFICPRNSNYSADHNFTRFKPRFDYFYYISFKLQLQCVS